MQQQLSKQIVNQILGAILDREGQNKTGYSGLRTMRLTPEAKDFLIAGKLLKPDGHYYTRGITRFIAND
jgi:hypothetical protein